MSFNLKPLFILFVCALLLAQSSLLAQSNAQINLVDVIEYVHDLDLRNFEKRIDGKTRIYFKVLKNTNIVHFELVNKSDKTGMKIAKITSDFPIKWSHENDSIRVDNSKGFKAKETYWVEISYRGTPADGLIISKNPHGTAVLFADNWPNRAHHWFPCIDHLSDKALVEFKVKHPPSYKVISNGHSVNSQNNSTKYAVSIWKSRVPLPTKVMVVGMADFAVSASCSSSGVEVNSWVYKEQADQGFSDYAVACEVLAWFNNKIGDYPYSKLANVQSKTRYGGMENASCIFYFENSVNGKNEVEDLIAHEIAHQWFGNSATEADWSHLWLSEGFATYLTDLYILEKFGAEKFKTRMQKERTKALDFYQKYQHPIIDTTYQNINHLLNPNSYQKGAWVLHMLRNELGNDLFWKIIKSYYHKYALSNANSTDFINHVTKESNKDLKPMLQQWLKNAGHPNLDIAHSIDFENKEVLVTIKQKQDMAFFFPLEIIIALENTTLTEKLQVNQKEQSFRIKAPLLSTENKFSSLQIDPEYRLFAQWTILTP